MYKLYINLYLHSSQKCIVDKGYDVYIKYKSTWITKDNHNKI